MSNDLDAGAVCPRRAGGSAPLIQPVGDPDVVAIARLKLSQ